MCRDELPRIFELRDLLPSQLPHAAYFQRFEESLVESPVKRKHFRDIEGELEQLDVTAWNYLKTKLQPLLTSKHPTRGWQPLFDTLNQAKGYTYLLGIGCTGIKFIPESSVVGAKTPDLEADCDSQKVLCEVKTINISDEEAHARTAIRGGDIRVRETAAKLSDGFFSKLKSDLEAAGNQMNAYCSEPSTKRIGYVIINFDDLLHEYADHYRQQIEGLMPSIGAPLEIVLDIKPPFYSATVE